MTREGFPKYVCEFCGTFALSFFVCFHIANGDGGGGPMPGMTPFCVGMLVCALAYALAPLSGGHINPALTLVLHLEDSLALCKSDALAYIGSQFLGGLIGASLAGACATVEKKSCSLPVFKNQGHFLFFHALVAEFVGTTLMLFVGMQVSSYRPNHYFALAIGFMACVCISSTAPISNGGLNPAVVLGANAAAHIFCTAQAQVSLTGTLAYCITDACGGLAALGLTRVVNSSSSLPAEGEQPQSSTDVVRAKRSTLIPARYHLSQGCVEMNDRRRGSEQCI
eukprot:TRINITY_DN57623_c0_g1_i1.p1 TRINITY_DN57623_c0_g1~~TRINITY_DN57623_c0_g1_i1.p1  ORF type:complete len:281 (+),score=20.26 TRINITY_DN57623_c0_g1_i1:46-888(+)